MHIQEFLSSISPFCNFGNHFLCRIIPDLVSQQRVPLPLECFDLIPNQGRTSNILIPERGQYSANHIIPCLVRVNCYAGETSNEPNEIPDVHFGCVTDIFWNDTNCEIWCPGMTVIRDISHMVLYSGLCLSSWVYEGICKGVSIVLCHQTSHIHIWSNNDWWH